MSIVGFDAGQETRRSLDGKQVNVINADLTAMVDVTISKRLRENEDIVARGIETGGPFELEAKEAERLLQVQENQNVIVPIVIGRDITDRTRDCWVIDFLQTPDVAPQTYPVALNYLDTRWHMVLEDRSNKRKPKYRDQWWLFRRSGEKLREIIKTRSRYIATPRVAKHRLFVWVNRPTVPDSAVFVIAREDDYFFGVLHSRPHELWALRLGTWLGKGNDPRYTPTTTFETFPFPWPPGQEPSKEEDGRVAAIAHWARELVAWRDSWLNLPPPPSNVVDTTFKKRLKQRTLTNLYNGLVYFRESKEAGKLWSDEFAKVTRKSVLRSEIQELDDIHQALDEAVLAAYGWPRDVTDEEILERLLGWTDPDLVDTKKRW